ncbi:hypothetical protein QE152_g40148 [Popillia japonica]|uniref:CCHC-type domain-containing protein n=1 Tax=Popillia japonica TaxID=7064 RepID=A0AAW1HSA3_POPJA
MLGRSHVKLTFADTKEQILIGLFDRNMCSTMLGRSHVDTDNLFHDLMEYERINIVRVERIRDSKKPHRQNEASSEETKGDDNVECKQRLPERRRSDNKPLCFKCRKYGHVADRNMCSTMLGRSHVDTNNLFHDLMEYERINIARVERIRDSKKPHRQNEASSEETKGDDNVECKQRLPERRRSDNKPLCFKCRKYGHVAKYCATLTQTNDKSEVILPICNMSKEMLTIEAGQKLGRGYLCVEDQVETDTGSMLAASTSRVGKIMDECHLGAGLSEDDVGQLRNLIEEYHDCFALSIGELGCVNDCEMKLQLTTDEPITHRPYRLSYAERMRVLKQIEELKAAGIVEESISRVPPDSHGARVQGKNSICHARRALPVWTNAISVGKWSGSVPKADQSNFGSIKRDGRRGNKPSASSIGSLKRVWINIESPKMPLTSRLNPRKCHLLVDRIQYLGFEISGDGIGPSHDKAEYSACSRQSDVDNEIGENSEMKQEEYPTREKVTRRQRTIKRPQRYLD